MNENPSLYVWNPRFSKGNNTNRLIQFTLTPFGGTNALSPNREMCIQILTALQIDALPLQWICTPFRTSYYSGDEASSKRWRIVWEMSMEIDRTIIQMPQLCYEFFEISEGGSYSSNPVEEGMELECRVIGDFQEMGDAERARSEIQRVKLDTNWWILNLSDRFIQLNLNLGRFGSEFFTQSFELGELIEHIIRENNGIPNNTEREDTWDIVFNEDGVNPQTEL